MSGGMAGGVAGRVAGEVVWSSLPVTALLVGEGKGVKEVVEDRVKKELVFVGQGNQLLVTRLGGGRGVPCHRIQVGLSFGLSRTFCNIVQTHTDCLLGGR